MRPPRGVLVRAAASRRLARARAADKKLGSKYVPSFLPPSMSASRGREERPASVFDLPARADKSKPRAIDAVLEEMQRCARARRVLRARCD